MITIETMDGLEYTEDEILSFELVSTKIEWSSLWIYVALFFCFMPAVIIVLLMDLAKPTLKVVELTDADGQAVVVTLSHINYGKIKRVMKNKRNK